MCVIIILSVCDVALYFSERLGRVHYNPRGRVHGKLVRHIPTFNTPAAAAAGDCCCCCCCCEHLFYAAYTAAAEEVTAGKHI